MGGGSTVCTIIGNNRENVNLAEPRERQAANSKFGTEDIQWPYRNVMVAHVSCPIKFRGRLSMIR